MNRHTEFVRFDCAGGIATTRKPGWNAVPLLKAITIICAILALAAVW